LAAAPELGAILAGAVGSAGEREAGSEGWIGTANAAPASDAKAFITNMHRELQAAIKASKDPKNDPKLLAIFDRTLDYKYLTRETLGRHAENLSAEQRAEFDSVLKQLVQASYRKNLRDPSGFEVEYSGQTPVEGATLVQTVTKNKNNKREKPLEVDYQVAVVDGVQLVQDVSTAGVSLVRNYRQQFGGIIRRKGFDELMKMMREKLQQLSGADG
jgi:phospholipid transport system substrate-binding protein